MTMRLFFVKKGKIEFLYRKDSTKEKDGWVSGVFSFFVDDTSVVDDGSLTDDPEEWKYFSYEVFPGMKDVSFIYQKYNSEANQHLNLEIKELRIVGTDYADEECLPCLKGFSQEGSDRCSLCPKDHFLNPGTGECTACPAGTHSPEGAISTSADKACLAKRTCKVDDIPKKYKLKCELKGGNPANTVEDAYFRPYTLDVTDMSSDNCELDTIAVDV